jgi:hypothetical protein
LASLPAAGNRGGGRAHGSGEGVAGGGGQGRREHPGAFAHPRSYSALLEAVPSTVATGAGVGNGGGPVAAASGEGQGRGGGAARAAWRGECGVVVRSGGGRLEIERRRWPWSSAGRPWRRHAPVTKEGGGKKRSRLAGMWSRL